LLSKHHSRAQAGHTAADIILDEHVRIGDKFLEDVFTLRLVQIQSDALFVGVEGEVEAAFSRVGDVLREGPLMRASSPPAFSTLMTSAPRPASSRVQ